MRNRIAVLALVLPALLLTGCGLDSDTTDGQSVEGGGGDFVNAMTLKYNGHDLYCVEVGKGLSCDWVRYHMENPS